MLQSYVPILLMFLVALVFGLGAVGVSSILGPRRADAVKASTYECGMEVTPGSWRTFDIRYYLVAMSFLIFDVEVVFLYPWAVKFKELGLFGFVEMLVFLFILLVGFIYIWRKGVLEWE